MNQKKNEVLLQLQETAGNLYLLDIITACLQKRAESDVVTEEELTDISEFLNQFVGNLPNELLRTSKANPEKAAVTAHLFGQDLLYLLVNVAEPTSGNNPQPLTIELVKQTAAKIGFELK